ncbi:MAG: flavodoxin family protein [Methanomicrobiales archaeon]|nr:flavodoxin family protein [Methanomicrobiales archaeon]
MEECEELIERKEVAAGEGSYTMVLTRRDLSSLYPGLHLFTLRLLHGDLTLALYRTNTYEYSPTDPLDAESAARKEARDWEDLLSRDPEAFFAAHLERIGRPPDSGRPDVLIIQGSPRADGNCSIIAGWAAAAAEEAGCSAEVVYPHDLWITGCIGCYQCYNTGFCTFADDMTGIISSLRQAFLLIICTPVYTSTVPGELKMVIDRFQAFHAEMTLAGRFEPKKGLLFSVSGRTGKENFSCVTQVIHDFMENLHITPSGTLLIDSIDRLRDVRNVPGLEDRIRAAVAGALTGREGSA